MSIVIKKKKKYNKKHLIQRILVLVAVYFISFFSLYAIFGEKPKSETQIEDEALTNIVFDNDGEKFLAQKNYPKAIEYYINAIQNNPDDYKGMNNLAGAYIEVKDYDKAKFYLFKAKEIAPNYTDTYFLLAKLYLKLKDTEAAENMINLMPLKTTADFDKKAQIFFDLASQDEDVEDKIAHLNIAWNYSKKQSSNLTDKVRNELIKNYFIVADNSVNANDKTGAIEVYKTILSMNDNCVVRNKLAMEYLFIDEQIALQHITKAVMLAKTQDEKRLTKETLINMRMYFAKEGENWQIDHVKELLDALDESGIMVDEKYTNITILNDKLEYDKDEIYVVPKISFQIKNQGNKEFQNLYAKITREANEKVLDEKTEQIINKNNPLSIKTQSDIFTIKFDKKIKPVKKSDYTYTISISTNKKNWQLYRILREEQALTEKKDKH